MERRENWILRDVIVINGAEILNKYQSSFMFFCLFVCFVFYGEDGCVAGASVRDYNTWGLTFFYISLISTRVVKWVLSNIGERLTWIYSNFYQEC